ncbi:MAG: LPS export ABC transporter periplasmic protein LptC [Alphaproteobacteria bacterium]|nr:LPS export ABC transporter periplasmic protein LptC [Alphaproteobacteria bacterium]
MTQKVVDLSNVKWGKNQTSGAADWQRRQRKRMRYHSRLVVSLKVLFPSLAAVMIGLVIAWPQMKAQQEDTVSLLTSETEQTSIPNDQVMTNPRFFTVDEKKEPFNLTADKAFELPGAERRIQLESIKADILKQGDRWIAVDARTGIYSQAEDTMELLEQVNLYTQNGEEMETTQALINMKNRDIVGKCEVFLRSSVGHVRAAEGFSVTQDGTVVRLTGKTRAVFYPENEEK